jgi:DNA-binding response OmpR family regulator
MSALDVEEGHFFYVLQDSIRILLVDDDPILREFGVVHLSSEAAEVETAADGLQALDVLARMPIDLVLLDLEMPNMNGFEVLRRIRSREETARLPVIVVTGHEDVSAIDAAYQAGATSFVVKPINWRQLSYQIRYVHRAVRADAPPPDAALSEILTDLARESAEFMRLALSVAPELRPAASAYAAALMRLSKARDAPGAPS